MTFRSYTYIGRMRRADVWRIWSCEESNRRKANHKYGTPMDARTFFVEPHGLWFWLLDLFWERNGIVEVWVEHGLDPRYVRTERPI